MGNCRISSRYAGLVLRVLHRLRYVSEQSPLDSATFSYAFPLIRAVCLQGGVGVEDPEEILEEITVSLDFVEFHVAECQYQFSSAM